MGDERHLKWTPLTRLPKLYDGWLEQVQELAETGTRVTREIVEGYMEAGKQLNPMAQFSPSRRLMSGTGARPTWLTCPPHQMMMIRPERIRVHPVTASTDLPG